MLRNDAKHTAQGIHRRAIRRHVARARKKLRHDTAPGSWRQWQAKNVLRSRLCRARVAARAHDQLEETKARLCGGGIGGCPATLGRREREVCRIAHGSCSAVCSGGWRVLHLQRRIEAEASVRTSLANALRAQVNQINAKPTKTTK